MTDLRIHESTSSLSASEQDHSPLLELTGNRLARSAAALTFVATMTVGHGAFAQESTSADVRDARPSRGAIKLFVAAGGGTYVLRKAVDANYPVPGWLPRAMTKLERLNADGLDAQSYEAAKELLNSLALNDIKPARIVSTAEDTVAVWIKSPTVKIRIEACDDGEFVMSRLHEEPPSHDEFSDATAVITEIAALRG
tara:strand:+ start:10380 stop:10970 length:591 start_codon:yes stop_codon:yes gene_type:complete